MNEQEAQLAGAAAMSLPCYQCHKRVWALKIEAVECDNAGYTLVPVDRRYLAIAISSDWFGKHRPEAGGYWVQYKDGYTSYSPAAAFEEGYSLVTNHTFVPGIRGVP